MLWAAGRTGSWRRWPLLASDRGLDVPDRQLELPIVGVEPVVLGLDVGELGVNSARDALGVAQLESTFIIAANRAVSASELAAGSFEVSNMAVVQLWLSELRKPIPPNSPMIAGLVASGKMVIA